ncbi:hypothetical protein TNCV_2656531 [Trichonephila clavipes]|nr:hypothetical protein TNCV_2656531 [Trichonephila clavipes]
MDSLSHSSFPLTALGRLDDEKASPRIKARKINLGEGVDVHLSLIVALGTILVTVRFSSVHPNFEGEPGGGQESPTSLLFPPTSREDLRLDGYLVQRHYTFINIHTFSRIQTQAQRHGSQRH